MQFTTWNWRFISLSVVSRRNKVLLFTSIDWQPFLFILSNRSCISVVPLIVSLLLNWKRKYFYFQRGCCFLTPWIKFIKLNEGSRDLSAYLPKTHAIFLLHYMYRYIVNFRDVLKYHVLYIFIYVLYKMYPWNHKLLMERWLVLLSYVEVAYTEHRLLQSKISYIVVYKHIMKKSD